MNKITIGQFLEFTNIYVPVYIEDEFRRYSGKHGKVKDLLEGLTTSQFTVIPLTDIQKECPIDYIRNVDGGHFGDNKKNPHSIVLGIGIENYEEYFGKE